MINKTIGIVIAIMLIGTVSAYSWATTIDNILHDLTCMDCTLDNPTFVNYSFPNGSGNGTWNHSELNQLSWSAAGHTIDSDLYMNHKDIYNLHNLYFNTSSNIFNLINLNSNNVYSQYIYSGKYHTDSLTPSKYICTNSTDYFVSCDGSTYNDTNITNYINQLQNNDTNHNSRLNSLESNDTVNYVSYPRYNFTNKNRVFNTTYTNNNNYPLYINAKVYVFGATASYICKINFYINNTLIDISYANVDYINRDPSDYRTFTYILSPSSNYRIDRTGNGACTEVLELVYEHPFY